MNQFRENDLQFLRYFAEFALMHDDTQNAEGSFQELMLLIRDWDMVSSYEFGYYDDHNGVAGKNYKKDHLDPRPDQPEQVLLGREQLCACFDQVSAGSNFTCTVVSSI